MRHPFSFRGRHPGSNVLALFASGDVPFFRQIVLKAHVFNCARCTQQLESFAGAIKELKHEATSETLTAFEAIADWKALEREMTGNIVVGVAASRCIEKVGRKTGWLVRVAIAMGAAGLLVAGWITHIPSEQTHHLVASLSRIFVKPSDPKLADLVQATSDGLAVRSQGVTLTILHPADAVVSLSGKSSLEARYVDEDSGQFTITAVYGQ